MNTMNRRSFLKNTSWSFLGLAVSGSLLSACQRGTAAGKKIMPSASNLKYFWGDLHNHCNITYGHGDMRSAFEAAKGNWILYLSLHMPCGLTYPGQMILA